MDGDPAVLRKKLHDLLRQTAEVSSGYLENNRSRMNYPEYRRAGLPVTTAWMESLVKQLNDRVKGTEMFWNNPEGAEAILQVRAAALCDDGRLVEHLKSRPGCPFIRRPKSPIFPVQNCKADVQPTLGGTPKQGRAPSAAA